MRVPACEYGQYVLVGREMGRGPRRGDKNQSTSPRRGITYRMPRMAELPNVVLSMNWIQ